MGRLRPGGLRAARWGRPLTAVTAPAAPNVRLLLEPISGGFVARRARAAASGRAAAGRAGRRRPFEGGCGPVEEPGCGPQRSRAGSTPRAGHRSRCPVTMSNVKAEDDITLVEREMKEFWAELKGVYGTEQLKQTLALRDSCKESLKVLSEKWAKKLKEGDLMIDKIQEYRNEILQQNKHISENQKHLTEIKSNLNHEEEQKKELTDSIQELKEELMKKKEVISSKNKAAKERVERLCKSKELFEERLGLEIRRIHDEQLQFIFRHIDHKDPDKPYVFTLSINDQGDYEVTSCTPPLDCIAEFQLKVRETNNFSAFVANIRKAFTALSYKQSA